MKITRNQLRRAILTEVKEAKEKKKNEGALVLNRKKRISESFSLDGAKVLKQNKKVVGFDAKPYISSIRKLIKLIKGKQNEDVDWSKEVPLMLIESGLVSDATDAMLKLATLSLFGVLPGGKIVKDVLLRGISGKVKDFIESKINHALVMRYLESANPVLYSIFKKEVKPAFNRGGSLNVSEGTITRKSLRRKLRKLILEAEREFSVRPVSDQEYKRNVSSLPPPMQAVSTGQRTSATVARPAHMVGNFFMTQGVPYKTPDGYGAIKKFIDFYMVMPNGEAILVNPVGFILEKVSDGIRFLKLLDQHVETLPIENI